MSLSPVSMAIISAVGETGSSAQEIIDRLKSMGYEDNTSVIRSVPNNLKLLEKHGYLEFSSGKWRTTRKGDDILKYGG